MNIPIIRQAVTKDVDAIAAFNTAMAWETEQMVLDPPTIHAGVAAALADEAKAIYFVAEIAGEVVGQLMITHEWSDWRNGDIWWIQSVYVKPEHRRTGVFKALFRHVEGAAKTAGAVAIRLYVEEQNSGAQATYASLGMQMEHYRVMGKAIHHGDADTRRGVE